jgi:acetylornithine deacetylase/succinyl-diaminopimelate desuccinylase-like protein
MKPMQQWLNKQRTNLFNDLAKLVAVPSVSTDGKHQREIAKCADVVANLMKTAGLENVRQFSPGKANPFVFAESLHAPDAPTVLLYAHHDVQPAAKESEWKSSPWKLTRRGGRLFGRGSADDKGAIVAQLGAIAAYLKSNSPLPLNVKMLVEGEEEIGSENLIPFVRTNRKLVDADVVIVCDTGNVATGHPSITYSLRGVISLRVEVQTADGPRHSGFAGGVMPDAAIALNVVLSRLFWANGKVRVPGFYDGITPMTPQQRKWIDELPADESKIRHEFGLLDGVKLANRVNPLEQTWRQPAITVIAQEASSLAHRSNQVLNKATAVVSCRIVPGQDQQRVAQAVKAALEKDPPWNARVTVTPSRGLGAWMTNPEGPAFEAARRALKSAYGKSAAIVGSGGSIGFVEPMARLLDDAPVLMLGIEDHFSNAHAPNESLHEDDWQKLILALANLFQELGHDKKL